MFWISFDCAPRFSHRVLKTVAVEETGKILSKENECGMGVTRFYLIMIVDGGGMVILCKFW